MGGSATEGRGVTARRHRASRRDVEALRERVYATFTGLAIVLVQRSNADHLDAGTATVTLAVGILAITAAGFAAEIIASLAVHAAFPDRAGAARMLRTAGGALASAALPLVLLVLAWAGVFTLPGALQAASIVYLVTLGVIAYLAVRRTRMAWWKQLVALGILLVLGALVIGLQQLAHGH